MKNPSLIPVFRWITCMLYCMVVSTVIAQQDTTSAVALLNEADLLYNQADFKAGEEKAQQARAMLEEMAPESQLLVRALLREADFAKMLDRQQIVPVLLEKAIIVQAKISGDRSAQVAAILDNLTDFYLNSQQFDLSIETNERALAIWIRILGEADFKIAEIYHTMAVCYFHKGQRKRATEFSLKCIDLISLYHPDSKSSMATIYNLLAKCSQDFEEALDFNQKSLEIRLAVAVGTDSVAVAGSYQNIGALYWTIGKADSSMCYYKKALAIANKSKERKLIGQLTFGIGQCLEVTGYLDSAEVYFHQSLKVLKEHYGGEHYDLGIIYNQLANFYGVRGHISKSREYHLLGLKITIEYLGEQSPELITHYTNLAESEGSFGNYKKAITWANKALDLYNLVDEEPYRLGIIHLNLGKYYGKSGKIQEAIFHYNKSLFYNKKADTNRNIDIVYEHLGSLFFNQTQYDSAFHYFDKSFEILKNENPAPSYFSAILTGLGLSSLMLGRDSIGFDYLERSRQHILNTIGLYPSKEAELADCLNALGTGFLLRYEKQRDITSLLTAFEYFRQGLSGILSSRVRMYRPDERQLLNEEFFRLSENTIRAARMLYELTNERQYAELAFDFSEQAKSNILRGSIAEGSALRFAGIPDSLLTEERRLRESIAWYQSKKIGLLQEGKSESDKVVLELDGRIFEFRQAQETLLKNFENTYPSYFSLKYDLRTTPLNWVQDTLLREGQSFLEYFTGDSSIFVFLITPGDFRIVEIKKDFPLEQWVERFREGICGVFRDDNQPAGLFANTLNTYVEYGTKLYEKLIDPIRNYLSESVIIIPDGALNYLPFEALLEQTPPQGTAYGDYSYLLRKHLFSYSYSATLLREMRQLQHRQKPKKTVAAFAPFFRGSYRKLESSLEGELNKYLLENPVKTRRGREFTQLPASGKEVFKVSKLWNGVAFFDPIATAQYFASVAGDYRIVHLSTHAVADNEEGGCFLVFAKTEDSIDNELVYAGNIYNLPLNADMVVLSACETALGKLEKGEGVMSLARAFTYAGAKSIVTSLWSVDDGSTGLLMDFFYKNLRKGLDKDEALRQAKLDFLEKTKENARHLPYYWAGFVPIGDMRALKVP